MNVLKILPSFEILPQRDFTAMPILVGDRPIASPNQDGSAQENRKIIAKIFTICIKPEAKIALQTNMSCFKKNENSIPIKNSVKKAKIV